MKKNNNITKGLLSCILMGCLFSVSFAFTTQQGQDLVNQLKDEGRTNEEIRVMINDIGLNANNYLPQSSTTQKGREIIDELKKNGWTEKEIKKQMEKMGVDVSGYFGDSASTNSSSNSESRYTSRNCKFYNIEYNSGLGVYTSPNLKKKEYFISSDYLKRYIDSKNPQTNNCPTNEGRISTFYNDNSNNSERFIAPNGKVYFITNQNGFYTSNELSKAKNFRTINELKNYIRDRNPLVWMGNSKTSLSSTNNANETIARMWSEVFN